MRRYQFHDDSGTPIDAHFRAQSGELILLSRGGSKNSTDARNTEYHQALDILLKRIFGSELMLIGVWVDSSVARKLPIEQRAIFYPEDAEATPQELYRTFPKRMASVARAPNAKPGGGYPTKRLRFAFKNKPPDGQIVRIAGWGITGEAYNRRLPAAILKNVNAVHIWRAAERIIAGEMSLPYKESTDYDVITEDGVRFPPKAVFGMAATEALGFEVRPRNIRGAQNTSCFKEIENAGYRIVPKGQDVPRAELPHDPEEISWCEGSKYLKSHFRRERKSGLSSAKRQAFKDEHGRLFCEKCGLDPVKTYGSDIGEACIEVHHIYPLGKGEGARITKLEDLECLCANCHRVIHREEYCVA